MICIRSIELTNVKNVGHGRIKFRDSPFGTRVTGIYGQNGSGKTTVVDAFECVRALMCGELLRQRSADLIGPLLPVATIEVELEVTQGSATSLGLSDAVGATVAEGQPFFMGYSFSFDAPDGQARLVGETVAVRSQGVPKRVLYGCGYDQQGRVRGMLPASRWRALRALAGQEAELELMVAQRSGDRRAASKVFCDAMMAFALAARERYEARQASGKLSRSAGEAYANTLVPLMDCVTLAATFAKDKLVVCNTQRNAVLAFNVFTLSAPDGMQGSWASGSPSSSPILRDVTLSVDKTTVVSAEVFQAVQATVATINRVLCQLVPGLSIEVRQLHDETLGCGAAGKRIEVLSHRGDVVVPFRTESEGIKKIVSMLGWLIDVYNDDSSCLVVDEIDSGVFEFLLGELLEVVSQRGRGQLIFTAHNLRALECLPSGCLVFTTVNPQNRYIRFRGSGASNNLRNQYLRAINLGGQKEPVYQPTNSADIDAAFFGAGCSADEDQVDFDDLLSRLAEGEGLLDLAGAAAVGALPAAGAVPVADASAGAAAGLTADAACADAADGDDSEVRHE